MGWGSSWDDKDDTPVADGKVTIIYGATSKWQPIKYDGMVTVDLDKDGRITKEGQHLIRNGFKNIPPTHDPYTNPNATIYYECGCGAILDPQTKSFAALNNYASEKGWKVRFGADSYVPYCVKCGEDVE